MSAIELTNLWTKNNRFEVAVRGKTFTNPESVLRHIAFSGRLPSYPEVLLAEECAKILDTIEAVEMARLIVQRHRILKDMQACDRKVRYADKKAAVSQINLIRRLGRATELRAYPCPQCAGWHLSKDHHEDHS